MTGPRQQGLESRTLSPDLNLKSPGPSVQWQLLIHTMGEAAEATQMGTCF